MQQEIQVRTRGLVTTSFSTHFFFYQPIPCPRSNLATEEVKMRLDLYFIPRCFEISLISGLCQPVRQPASPQVSRNHWFIQPINLR